MTVALLRAGAIAMLLALSGAALAADPLPASDAAVAGRAAELSRASTVMGNARGNVTIIEFMDYTCSYCKAVQPRLEALLRADKNVKLIIKEYPILVPESLVAAKAAMASVKQGKYAAFHNALMNYEGPLSERAIFDTAQRVGINVVRLRADMKNPAIADEIIGNFNQARALRIFQTPGFIVGNHILTGLSAEIDFPKEVAAARKRK